MQHTQGAHTNHMNCIYEVVAQYTGCGGGVKRKKRTTQLHLTYFTLLHPYFFIY